MEEENKRLKRESKTTNETVKYSPRKDSYR
jgi:hypothetical protein